MKLSIVAVAAVVALSSPAFAQSYNSDGLNGANLGKSMRGVNNGVPYPNTNATRGTVGSGGGRYYGAPGMRHHRHHRHHEHYGHHRHYKHH